MMLKSVNRTLSQVPCNCTKVSSLSLSMQAQQNKIEADSCVGMTFQILSRSFIILCHYIRIDVEGTEVVQCLEMRSHNVKICFVIKHCNAVTSLGMTLCCCFQGVRLGLVEITIFLFKIAPRLNCARASHWFAAS